MKRMYGNLFVCLFLILPVYGYAGETEQVQVRSRQQLQSQFATPEERAAHQESMQNSRTQEEREALRNEHSQTMQSRAREQGLPDAPTRQGSMGGGRGGAGAGSGRGGGMGRGR